MSESATTNETPRRGFLAGAAATVLAALLGLGPLVAGLVSFVDPLGRRKSKGGNFVRVTGLDALPADGKPYRFVVIDDRNDAWSYYPPEPVGAIYLRRDAEDATPVAITTVCPHLGCSVDWQTGSDQFFCPCHQAGFAIDGSRPDPSSSPSPRDLDTLEVEIRDNAVWVDYRNFKGGVSEKVEA